MVANPACCGDRRGEINFPCPRSRLRICTEGGWTAPFHVSSFILHIQAESGVTSRQLASFLLLATVSLLHRQTSSGQSRVFPRHAVAYQPNSPPRVHRHRAISPQGRSINFGVIPVLVPPWTTQCVPLFLQVHYLLYLYSVGICDIGG